MWKRDSIQVRKCVARNNPAIILRAVAVLVYTSKNCLEKVEYVEMVATAMMSLQKAHTKALLPESSTSTEADDTLSQAVTASR